MSKRIFYVVYFENHRLQASLDAMRFIANPKEKSPAHITIRGPYTRAYNICGLERRSLGAEVVTDGIGAFFYDNQNTIFIRCHSKELRKVWKKSDFDFNPHITIYDGFSRSFASMLLDRLQRRSIRFRFSVSALTLLESHKGQYSTWLRDSFDEQLVSRVAGNPLATSEVDGLSPERRVAFIESLARELPESCSSLEDTPDARVYPSDEVVLDPPEAAQSVV